MMKLYIYFVACLSILGCSESNDGPGPQVPQISVSDVTVFEGDDNKEIGVELSLSNSSTDAVTVDFRTEEFTAAEGEDFSPSAGSVTIEPGEMRKTISIEVIGDTLKEPEEAVKIFISNAQNAELGDDVGLLIIKNDDTFADVPEDGYITKESYTGYDLVWRDEFDGTEIDPANWTHEIGGDGWGNNERQYYTDRSDNSYLSDGKLVIEAKEEIYQGSAYTSARMITLDKQEYQFGRVDVRAKLPEGQGIWPAIWMLGANIQDIGWPACGEIDIMELVGHEPSTTHGTAHWGPEEQPFSTFSGSPYNLTDGTKFSDQYHVFTIVWSFNEIKWYVDDNEFFKLTKSQVGNFYPFNNPFFVILNVAVGGNWPGYPDETTVFPQRMHVDYVRVFQLK